MLARFTLAVLVSQLPNAIALKVKAENEKVVLDAAVHPDSWAVPTCPSMFVAIVSRPDNKDQRDHIREMWRKAGEEWGVVKAKFTLCSLPELPPAVYAEQQEHQDLIFMDCEEGYKNGVLTRKVEAAMQTYLDDFSDYDLFMKIDDDTFMSARRVCSLLSWRQSSGKDNLHVYMGVFAEGVHEAVLGKHFPNRDPSSTWYEPFEKFDGATYPVSAKGGPGYILGRPLVEHIIYRGIAETNELNNEDKAIGVWVDKLLQYESMPIDVVNIPGTDGYDEHYDSITTTGSYKKYPHFLHHHLAGSVIDCLYKVDAQHDPDAHIDHCFKPPP